MEKLLIELSVSLNAETDRLKNTEAEKGQLTLIQLTRLGASVDTAIRELNRIITPVTKKKEDKNG